MSSQPEWVAPAGHVRSKHDSHLVTARTKADRVTNTVLDIVFRWLLGRTISCVGGLKFVVDKGSSCISKNEVQFWFLMIVGWGCSLCACVWRRISMVRVLWCESTLSCYKCYIEIVFPKYTLLQFQVEFQCVRMFRNGKLGIEKKRRKTSITQWIFFS